MSIIIFIIILGLLIFVHELGHFLIAKWSKIRVDEFAIGFPPKIFSFTRGGTKYALNSIPFGGYVKIFGENPDEESLNPDAKNSFVNKNRWIQAAVLIAGVTFNVIFAWLLISSSYMISFPALVTDENISQVENVGIYISGVESESPAGNAGLKSGDEIKEVKVDGNILLEAESLSIESVQKAILENSEKEIEIVVERSDEQKSFVVTPEEGLVEGKKTIGIMMAKLGDLKLNFFEALGQGFETTLVLTKETFVGFFAFLGKAITGQADFDQVSLVLWVW
jgi:regulator of sigma E protease